MCVALLGYCTAFKLSYLNKGTKDGAPFIPQILLIRRKCTLNENLVFWLTQEALWIIHLGQSQHLLQAG